MKGLAKKLYNLGAVAVEEGGKIVAIEVSEGEGGEEKRLMNECEFKCLGIDPNDIGEIGRHPEAIREGPWVRSKNDAAFYSTVTSEWY